MFTERLLMEIDEEKQSRVTNSALQTQLTELSVRFSHMEKDIQEIKGTLCASGEKVNTLEKSEAGYHPLIENRLQALERRTDKHGIEIDELVKISQSLASAVKLLNWVTGIVGAGVLTWVVTQVLSLVK